MSIPEEAKILFLECFGSSAEDTDIILGYAIENGRLDIAYKNGDAANMMCSTRITDLDFSADYIFAACTKLEFRGQGMFRSRLEALYGSSPLVLIPENEGLIPFYEKLGFSPIFGLEADVTGFDGADDFDGDIKILYEIYKRSFQFPKKDFRLFDASIKAHIAYGGAIKTFDDSAVLITEKGAVDIYAKSETDALNAAKAVSNGIYKALFPLSCAHVLNENCIKYRKKCIAMGRNIAHNDIYINTLFN